MIQNKKLIWRLSVGLLTSVALVFIMLPQLVNGALTAIKAPSTGGYIVSDITLAAWIILSALSLFVMGSQSLRLREIWLRALGVIALFLALNLVIWSYSTSIDSSNLRHAAPYLFVFISGAAAAPHSGCTLRFVDRCSSILTLSASLLLTVALSVGWIRIFI
jgi:hypothetical protein